MKIRFTRIRPVCLSAIKSIFTLKKSAGFWGLLFMCIFYACHNKESSEKIAEEDQFSLHIRTTEARTPDQEQSGFQLPPGFEIQLFAAEPQIGKPLNMAFDARGRMWLTQSYEYPFPDTTGAGKDKISILEDTDGDGSADIITDFADSLNIPIGIIPVKGGAIAYSIPNVYYFKDNDGDDKADEKRIVLSGFEHKDTHGMINNFFRGLDGWIHGSHGFANTSSVTDRNGKTIIMQSGNMFRFRDDGSNVEFTSTGRVNPFGHTYDEMGYVYSVDCHTTPIYQLIRGADYPHFGKQPTGIGFGPATEIENQRGATALAGLEYYIAPQFPPEYQNSFYYGDVVKSRVYRSSMKKKGTTAYITQEEDFIVSQDPWFRPVDVKLGPDGALYIADFYNRIIGHYEVPLDHPGRDRERGRIWRVVYTGDKKPDEATESDWSDASLQQLINGLGQENLPLRTILADQIMDRFDAKAVEPLNQAFNTSNNTGQQIQILWLLYRLNALPNQLLITALKHKAAGLRVHALRIMFEYEVLSKELIAIAQNCLNDTQPDVIRAAVMLLARHPDAVRLPSLFSVQKNLPAYDSHLKYVIRQCLRDHLRENAVFRYIINQDWDQQEITSLIDVVVGVDSELAAEFIIQYLKSLNTLEAETLIRLSAHASRFVAPKDLNELVLTAKTLSGDDMDLQYGIYEAIKGGIDRRGTKESQAVREWAISLGRTFLDLKQPASTQWRIAPIEKSIYDKNTWQLVEVDARDQLEATTALLSGPFEDDRQMSQLYSPDFIIPETFSFQLFGNKHESDAPDVNTNVVQLRLSASDKVIQEAYITGQNIRQKVSWHNGAVKGQQGYLAIVDGSASRDRFIGIGQLTPSIVELPQEDPELTAKRQLFAANVAGRYKLKAWQKDLEEMFLSTFTDLYAKAAAAESLLLLDNRNLDIIASVITKEDTQPFLIESIAKSISKINSTAAPVVLRKALEGRPYSIQKEIVLALAQSKNGIDQLLEAVTQLEVVPRILLERQVNEYLLSTASKAQIALSQKLTKDVKKPDEEIQALINKRLATFQRSRNAVTGGSETFVVHCAPCHQINGNGGSIGPQLDGIGNWGARALTEKILDPNRNISKAFINYNIKLKDGTNQSGLFRRQEGALLVFANASGQEFTIAEDEIAEKNASPYTLMPDHFNRVIKKEEFYLLLNYLLTQK
ncbi:c-type cytochrome [Fulvivirgaceae bacterium BMA12]|uniref:C-type cytochrome n=1 Tax=Agaribacillus aureus TaxID=3051825 RepID=A0ABT8L2I4_9BACT|nr:c-type cytochrome [Fulvivirgaceae bacterium BMA12]